MVDRERYGERSVDKKNTETGLVEEVATTPVVQTWVETCRYLCREKNCSKRCKTG